jgi:hypothetical protein
MGNHSLHEGVSAPMSPARTVRTLGIGLALSLGATLAMLTAPAVTLADCMQPPPVAEAVKTAEVVFVGTVTETSNRNSWATVQVEDVWKGPDLPAVVLIKGGPGGNAATSVDRTFEVGVKYLFFPLLGNGTEPAPAIDTQIGLVDNSCTNTTPWVPELAGLRPADARAPGGAAPEASGFDAMSVVVPAGVALLVAGLLLGVGLLARGRDAS